MRLALALSRTVGELLDTMDSEEISWWIAFDSVDPIGAWRTDYSVAMLCALQANSNRGRGQKPLTVNDFMPFLPVDEDKKLQDGLEALMAMVASKQQNAAKTDPPIT
jgi:hypothetical protein